MSDKDVGFFSDPSCDECSGLTSCENCPRVDAHGCKEVEE